MIDIPEPRSAALNFEKLQTTQLKICCLLTLHLLPTLIRRPYQIKCCKTLLLVQKTHAVSINNYYATAVAPNTRIHKAWKVLSV